jgi:hypothetical protein
LAPGSSSTSPEGSCSTSKATNVAGVVSASMFTRLAAGWMRSDNASKSRRPSRPTTSSPSSTTPDGRPAASRSTISGKYLFSGLLERDCSTTSSPSRKTRQRNPSHFGSKIRSESSGMVPAGLASIGLTGGVSTQRR